MSDDALETRTQQLMQVCGWPHERALAAARQQLGIIPKDPELDGHILEKEEQAEVMKLFRGLGVKVYNNSQARAAKVSAGIPDLWCVHAGVAIAFWFETKRQVGGEYSSAQLDFRRECELAGVNYGTGDRYAAAKFLVSLGIVAGASLPSSHIPAGRPG